jgi:hypothetical protein
MFIDLLACSSVRLPLPGQRAGGLDLWACVGPASQVYLADIELLRHAAICFKFLAALVEGLQVRVLVREPIGHLAMAGEGWVEGQVDV